MRSRNLPLVGTVALLVAVSPLHADLNPRVAAVEKKRIAAVEKARPAVVAVFDPGGQGGGSGVLISDDGYALTNFHVVGSKKVMQCGLPDGHFYDTVLVGLDKVGDVALIKLLPKKEGDRFPFAVMADSDKVKPGDWAFAMGNPFLLATDFTPTVTYGMVSGVNRYQEPSGVILEYTDCIQIDTSINPGNSGGPLFNADGDLIGINGRGSFEKRGRVNSGVGYAISINQIKNFLGQLRAGLDTDHASLGALVESDMEEGAIGRMLVRSIIEECDAHRRGLDVDAELVSFAGRPMMSVNQYKNVLGLYPKGWRVPLVFRTENDKKETIKKEVLVRLMGVQRQEVGEGGRTRPREDEPRRPPMPPDEPRRPMPGDEPRRPMPPTPPAKKSPASKFYEAKVGYANWYFNKLERDSLLKAFRKQGDLTQVGKDWVLETEDEVKGKRRAGQVFIGEEKDADGKGSTPLVRLTIDQIEYTQRPLDPLKPGEDIARLKEPRNSGGLMMALYHWHQLLTIGEKAFPSEFSHGGVEPLYPPGPEGSRTDYTQQRIDCEVLRTEQAGVTAKWYFSPKDKLLAGFEVSVEARDDPCEVYLSDYKAVDGRQLPHRFDVIYGNNRYATLTVKKYTFSSAKP